MSTTVNPLVIKEIDSLNTNEKTKEIIKELIRIEIEYGSENKTSKLKESQYRKIISKGVND